MILVTKTSDQAQQRGHNLSSCAILTWALSTLCSPSASLLLSRLSGLAATEPTLSFLFFFLSPPVSPPFPALRLQLFCGFLRFFASLPPSPMCVWVWVCVFIKLHIAAQFGPVLLLIVILCHSHWSSQGGINDMVLVTVCVCWLHCKKLLLTLVFPRENQWCVRVCVCVWVLTFSSLGTNLFEEIRRLV